MKASARLIFADGAAVHDRLFTATSVGEDTVSWQTQDECERLRARKGEPKPCSQSRVGIDPSAQPARWQVQVTLETNLADQEHAFQAPELW